MRNNWNNRNRNDYGNNQRGNSWDGNKRSSWNTKQVENGKVVGYGFIAMKGDFLQVYARPYKGTHETKSKSGRVWMNYFVTIRHKNMTTTKTSGLFEPSTGKCLIKEFGLLCTRNGGGRTRNGRNVTGAIVRIKG